MKRLFTIDEKDYDETWPRSCRPSVRAIIERDGKFALVHGLKYDYYMFPGGGMEGNESHEEALIREVNEETGLTVILDTIREFGSILRIQKSLRFENTIFEQENYYYRCEVREEIGAQKLEDYEADEQFTLEFVKAEVALQVNRSNNHLDENDSAWVERESKVLEMLIAEKNR